MKLMTCTVHTTWRVARFNLLAWVALHQILQEWLLVFPTGNRIPVTASPTISFHSAASIKIWSAFFLNNNSTLVDEAVYALWDHTTVRDHCRWGREHTFAQKTKRRVCQASGPNLPRLLNISSKLSLSSNTWMQSKQPWAYVDEKNVLENAEAALKSRKVQESGWLTSGNRSFLVITPTTCEGRGTTQMCRNPSCRNRLYTCHHKVKAKCYHLESDNLRKQE